MAHKVNRARKINYLRRKDGLHQDAQKGCPARPQPMKAPEA
jgi:hypothetical protein